MHRQRGGITNVVLAFLIVLVLFGCVIGGCAVSGYNKAIRLDENVKNAWAQVENVLQRRYDLIPNLVETVRGYAKHEEKIFTEIARSRERYFQAGSRSGRLEAAAGIERALSRLLMLQERYPELKAEAHFRDLMVQLEGTENRIAVERKRYNDAVRELNAFRRSLIGRIFAGWAGIEEAKYFEPPETVHEAPKVNFDEPTTQPTEGRP